MLAICNEGFTLSDMRGSEAFDASGLGTPDPTCNPESAQGHPLTFCARAQDGEQPLIDRLPWYELYNRLVAIHDCPLWRDSWGSSLHINIVASPELEFEIVQRAMDVARMYREANYYASNETLLRASSRSESGLFVPLFNDPVLLLPNP